MWPVWWFRFYPLFWASQLDVWGSNGHLQLGRGSTPLLSEGLMERRRGREGSVGNLQDLLPRAKYSWAGRNPAVRDFVDESADLDCCPCWQSPGWSTVPRLLASIYRGPSWPSDQTECARWKMLMSEWEQEEGGRHPTKVSTLGCPRACTFTG
jgi:hypothetical protein